MSLALKINLRNNREWLLASMLFVLSNPYFFWHTSVPLIVKLLLACVVFFNFEIKSGKESIGYACLFLFYLLVGLRHNGSILGMFFILFIPFYISINSTLLISAYKKFIKILSVITVLSLFSYILVIFFHVPLPNYVAEPLNPLKDFDYLCYPFLIMENRDIGLSITRFYGIFDEPGVFGSMAALILCKEHFDLKKKELIPILLGGILTFSLYFYIVCICYMLLYKKTKIKILIIILALLILPSLLIVEDLYVLLFRRFMFEDGEWLGNSRYGSSFSMWYDDFRNSADYFWGKGSGFNLIVNEGGASYKDIIVNYGIIVFALYILSYTLLSLKTNLKESLLSLFLILTFIFQRPFIFDLSIIYMFIYCFSYDAHVMQNNTSVKSILCVKN